MAAPGMKKSVTTGHHGLLSNHTVCIARGEGGTSEPYRGAYGEEPSQPRGQQVPRVAVHAALRLQRLACDTPATRHVKPLNSTNDPAGPNVASARRGAHA